MLRIITKQRGERYRVELHGRIGGDWVAVLERHWQGIVDASPSVLVTVDLSNVVFIDRHGERLLRDMVRYGVGFCGAGCMSRYVIETISGGMRWQRVLE